MKIEIPNIRIFPSVESAFNDMGLTVINKILRDDRPHVIQLELQETLNETQKDAVRVYIETHSGSAQVFFDDDANAETIFS